MSGLVNAWRANKWSIIALALTIGLILFIRVRLVGMPLERDEGEYAYAGQLMLQGIPPYQLAYNMKLPGTYAAYALIMAALGESTRAIHLGLLLINILTILVVYALGRRLFGKISAVVAAAAFALFSLSDAVLGLAAHATHFVTLFAALGAFCLWNYLERSRFAMLAASGACFGLAFLMKQHAVFFILFGGLVVLWQTWPTERKQWRRALTESGIYAAAAVLPFALTCAILAGAGVFSKFWFWTFSYAREYATHTPLTLGWVNFKLALSYFQFSVPTLCLVSAFGFIVTVRDETDRRRLFFSLGLLLCAFATACPGLYFREHYFIPILLPAALFAGVAVQWLCTRIRQSGRPKSWLIIPWLIIGFACADTLWRNRQVYFRLDPDAASRAIYAGNPFAEAVAIAQYIHDHSKPNTLIAVVGSEPEIYFYSGRHSATGYIYTYPLMEVQAYAQQMQGEMIREIEARRPEFVVYTDVRKSWLARPGSHHDILDWFQQYSARQLSVVGLIELFPNGQARYRWDEKAVAITPETAAYIEVFRRLDAR